MVRAPGPHLPLSLSVSRRNGYHVGYTPFAQA